MSDELFVRPLSAVQRRCINARLRAGMGVDAAASAMGVDPRVIYAVEDGLLEPPDDLLVRMEAVYQATIRSQQ